MSYEQLAREIDTKLDERAERQQEWEPRWITNEICHDHRGGLVTGSEHATFWEHTGYSWTRKLVTERINQRADSKTVGKKVQQLSFPGFDREHVQDYYVVCRDGVDKGICVLDLTDEEIDAKAEMYRKQAAANIAHATELERFKYWRAYQRQAQGATA